MSPLAGHPDQPSELSSGLTDTKNLKAMLPRVCTVAVGVTKIFLPLAMGRSIT